MIGILIIRFHDFLSRTPEEYAPLSQVNSTRHRAAASSTPNSGIYALLRQADERRLIVARPG